MRRSIFNPASLVIVLLLVFNYRPIKAIAQEAPEEPQTVNINVFAASSLTNALQEIEPLYEQSRQNVDLNYNFAASGTLANQILQGAPADVFFSAAEREVQILEDANLLLPETRRDVLNNSLAIVTPVDSTLSISSVQDLTNPEVSRVVIGIASTVPAGEYAQQLFNSFEINDQIQPKLVFGNNVREVLSLVETGNADVGIVYITDALQSSLVQVANIPPTDAYSPIIYPVAVLQTTPNPDAAIDFSNFLSSSEAVSVFERFGFTAANTFGFTPANAIVPASVSTPNSTLGQVSVPDPSSLIGVFALATLSIGLGWKRKKLCAES